MNNQIIKYKTRRWKRILDIFQLSLTRDPDNAMVQVLTEMSVKDSLWPPETWDLSDLGLWTGDRDGERKSLRVMMILMVQMMTQ